MLALKSAAWIELSQGMVCGRAFPKYRLQNPESLWQCVYLEAMEMPTWSLAVSFTPQVKNKQPRAFLATKETTLFFGNKGRGQQRVITDPKQKREVEKRDTQYARNKINVNHAHAIRRSGIYSDRHVRKTRTT